MEKVILNAAESSAPVYSDLKRAIPRAAELLNVDSNDVIVQDMWYFQANGYMSSRQFRDTAIKAVGPLEDMPRVAFYGLHSRNMEGHGITLYQTKTDPSLKYCVFRTKGEYTTPTYIIVPKGSYFRLRRHAVRMAKLCNRTTQPPVLEDGLLHRLIQNSVEFIRRSKEIAKYGVRCKRGIILDGPPGNGKAQPLSSIVMTPAGPVTMGEIKKGDVVCTPDGGTAKVLDTFPQGIVDIYRIHFSDGTHAECCENHLWKVESMSGYKDGVLETKFLKGREKASDGKRLYSIPMTKPVAFNAREHIIAPYLLGVLLGDGSFSQSHVLLSVCEQQIKDQVEALLPAGYRLMPPQSGRPCDYMVTRPTASKEPAALTQELRRMGLMGMRSESKFVPEEYLYDSIDNRTALLQGLMDTDGFAHKDGVGVSFCTVSSNLASGVRFLVESLGGKCTITEMNKKYTYKGEVRTGKTALHCQISLPDDLLANVFKLNRKKDRVKARSKYPPKRMIDKIEFHRQEEAKCILLDSEDHLYLTDHFIVTHNTMACRYVQRLCIEYGIRWGTVTSADIDKAYTDKKLNDLFTMYTVTFFDDIDISYLNRQSGNGKMACSLLTAMDGMSNQTNLVRIFTTNETIESLDAAFTRPGRIDLTLTFKKPDAALRTKLVNLWPVEILLGIDVPYLISKTEGCSFAELESVRTTLVTNKLFNNAGWDLKQALEDMKERQRDKSHSVGFALP